VFVEAKEPVATPAIPETPPTPVAPVPVLPEIPAVPSPEAAPVPAEKAATIMMSDVMGNAGDLLSQALSSSMEAPAPKEPSFTFTPAPSSITAVEEKVEEQKEESPTPPATFVVPAPTAPESPAEEVTKPVESVPVVEVKKEEAQKPVVEEVVSTPPVQKAPEVVEQTASEPEKPSFDPEDSPDLPDVSGDIKRILQERWITLANGELSKLEKRHAEISGALVDVEREQQELMAKKLKLENEQVQVERSRTGWEYKKQEALTTLDKVVKDISSL
jgi:hypothetical protein